MTKIIANDFGRLCVVYQDLVDQLDRTDDQSAAAALTQKIAATKAKMDAALRAGGGSRHHATPKARR